MTYKKLFQEFLGTLPFDKALKLGKRYNEARKKFPQLTKEETYETLYAICKYVKLHMEED